jgi:hypothetical protein
MAEAAQGEMPHFYSRLPFNLCSWRSTLRVLLLFQIALRKKVGNRLYTIRTAGSKLTHAGLAYRASFERGIYRSTGAVEEC